MKTIKSIKAWIKKEEKRLKQRTLENNTAQELSSLQGSIMTLKKLNDYLQGEKA